MNAIISAATGYCAADLDPFLRSVEFVAARLPSDPNNRIERNPLRG